MNKIFDTTPFSYVGNSKDYKDLTKEELDELKSNALVNKDKQVSTLSEEEMNKAVSDPVEKEALPSSDEVEESSASVVGQMLPQVGLTESNEPDVDNVLADVNEDAELLKEALSDTINGSDIYFESAEFIEKLKNKFNKDTDTDKIKYSKVLKTAKAYTAMKLATSRVKIIVTQNSKVKETSEYRELQKKAINAEKEYRKLKKDLNEEELNVLNEYINGFDSKFNKKVKAHISDIKDAKTATIKKESVEAECGTTDVVTEKNLDPEMKPLLEKLHSKGYKTRASSSGHKNVTIKKDGDKDNVAEDHHYGDARLVFDKKYNFGKAPKYWYWKKVDDDIDYLDVEQIAKDESPDNGDKFDSWKDKYMKSLTNWIDELPNASDDNSDKEVEEACEVESVDEIYNTIDTIFECGEDNDVYLEGANMQIRKRYKTDRSEFKKCMKEIKSCIKSHEYADARNKLNEGIQLIRDNKSETLKEIDNISDNNILISFCGIALRNIVGFVENLNPTLLFFQLKKVHFLNDFREIKRKYNENGGKLKAKDLNTYFIYIRQCYDKMIFELNSMHKVIDGYEKSYNEKMKTESTESIESAINMLYESVMSSILAEIELDNIDL